MSIDTPTAGTVERAAGATCGVCDGPRPDGDGRVLACYATDGVDVPGLAAADGVLACCGECAGEVRALTDAWSGIERPAVAAESSIAATYREAAPACSFCESPLATGDDGKGPTLGLEAWAPGHPARLEPDDHAHYVLCETCVPIFAEFLEGVRDDA